jgi:hypothetical protein
MQSVLIRCPCSRFHVLQAKLGLLSQRRRWRHPTRLLQRRQRGQPESRETTSPAVAGARSTPWKKDAKEPPATCQPSTYLWDFAASRAEAATPAVCAALWRKLLAAGWTTKPSVPTKPSSGSTTSKSLCSKDAPWLAQWPSQLPTMGDAVPISEEQVMAHPRAVCVACRPWRGLQGVGDAGCSEQEGGKGHQEWSQQGNPNKTGPKTIIMDDQTTKYPQSMDSKQHSSIATHRG